MDMIKIRLGGGLKEMEDQVEQMMDDMLQLGRTFAPRSASFWAPPTDLYETPEEIVILTELAGLKSDQIQVVMDQGMLRIKGVRGNPIRDPGRRVHQMEVDFGAFERRIRVRVPIDMEGVQATYRDGFLMIRIPKARAKDREIPVKG